MATIILAEEIADNYDTDEIISWAESELKTMRQIALSKEADKSFLLGRITTGISDVANVLEALRKKRKPETKNEPPVVA